MLPPPGSSGPEVPAGRAALDAESSEWLRSLSGPRPERDRATERLHQLLVRIARSEANRRNGRLQLNGAELDDLVHQAAADALLAIMVKISQFRGDSRFTTWAYKFVIYEVSNKMTRHFWRKSSVPMDAEDWDKLPDRFGLDPTDGPETRELLATLRRAVDQDLTERQRRIFVAVVLNRAPLDAVVMEFGGNRNAVYKTLFDARRKLRAALGAEGYPVTGV